MTTKVREFQPTDVRHVLQPTELHSLITALETHVGLCILDLETTGLREHWRFARVVTASLTLPVLAENGDEIGYPLTYVVGLSHPDAPMHTEWRKQLTKLASAIQKSKLGLVGHNIRFDVRWITATTGIDLTNQIVGDTGMTSHLLNENITASLKPRAMATFGLDSWMDFDWADIEKQQRKDPRYPHCPLLAERVEYFTMAMYNARDTYWTWRLYQNHTIQMGLTEDSKDRLLEDGDTDSLNDLRLGQYYKRVSMNAVRTITRLEQFGMQLDVEWCRNRMIELREIMDLSYTELLFDGGMPDVEHEVSFAPTSLWFRAWSEMMVDEGKLRVIGITPGGNPAWGKAILNRLARDPQFYIAQILLDWRRANTELQFITSWLELVDTENRIHSTYNYYRVITGRLSSQDPNMQQVPKSAKKAFCAAPGYALVRADYSQIELRVAAHQAPCEPMIEAFKQGKDLHRVMAAIMAGCAEEDVTPDQRQGAKAGNFGFLFGMQAHKFVTYADDTYGVVFTHEEAEAVRTAFFETWTGMQEWHNRMIAASYNEGFVKSPLGRLRRNPDPLQAINSPVQGMASDMMTLAAGIIMRTYPQVRPVALVHDAIYCEVPIELAEQLATGIKHAMEFLVLAELKKLGCDFRVPLVADVTIDEH